MAKLIMMSGIPGSGKSTWAKNHMKASDIYISRDDIRFSMLNETDDYFAHEDEVIKEFFNRINNALANGYNVIADATHLNKSSRANFLSKVEGYEGLEIVYMDIPLCTALERNDLRTNRAFVPRGVIRRMWNQYQPPTFEEGFDKIYKVDKDNKISIIIKEI